jgi:putative ABC transport system permease protein
MVIKYHFKTALTSLGKNKFRTALTILGIVIGIAAIMGIMSLGKGAQNLILSQFRSFGSKFIIITPGREPQGLTDIAGEFLVTSLKERELEALKKKSNVPNAIQVIPISAGATTGSWQGETYKFTVYGTTPYFAKLYDIDIAQGLIFSDDDVRNNANVIVIGDKIKEELFGQNEALGQKIRIKDRNFQVIGILSEKSGMSLVSFGETAFVPYTTFQQYVLGIKHFQHIMIEADSEENVAVAVRDITATLRDLHNITDPKKDDFYVQTYADMLKQVNMASNIMTLLLVTIAAISLLVGGVGIMNVMLVSVTERTAEIGLRKAIGATTNNIMTQFLCESVLLTFFGGIIGVALGGIFSFGSSIFLTRFLRIDWPFAFPISAMFLGLAMAALTGLVFGIYPARQAAQKNPIEALRYE